MRTAEEPGRASASTGALSYCRLMTTAGRTTIKRHGGRSLPARLLAAGSLLAIATALVSCATPTGHIQGVTYLRGGIIETTRADAQVTATATTGDTTQVFSATTRGGSFSFDLPPGTYELQGRLTTRLPGGYLTPDTVTVTAGETTTIDLYANVP